jgi:hypothetical protein
MCLGKQTRGAFHGAASSRFFFAFRPAARLGGNVFGWSVDEATSFRLLDMLIEAGLTAIDTADVYSR